MLTQKAGSCVLKVLQIERRINPAHAPGFHTGPHLGFEQHISVASRLGTGAAMEVTRHLVRPLHCDIARQKRIDAAHPSPGLAHGVGIEMHDLHQAMNAGIGTASAQGGQAGLAGRGSQCTEFGKRSFELVLHGLPGGLALPALVSLPVVTETERNPHMKSIMQNMHKA